MMMIDPATGWFKIFEIPTYYLDEVMGRNDDNRYKLYIRFSQLFNSTWLSRYHRSHKLVFDNESEFKQDLTPLLNNFDIRPVLTTTKNLQANAPVERVHQVILNMLVAKEIDKKVFNYIDP